MRDQNTRGGEGNVPVESVDRSREVVMSPNESAGNVRNVVLAEPCRPWKWSVIKIKTLKHRFEWE